MNTKNYEMRRLIVRSCIVVFIFSSLAICAVSVWFFNLLLGHYAQQEINCATYDARPIPEGALRSLCDNHLIPVSLGECRGDAPRLQDVVAIVESNVIPIVSTYDDVARIFGSYETYCETPGQDTEHFRCAYNVTGVGPLINIWYTSRTRIVESIRVSSCRSGS